MTLLVVEGVSKRFGSVEAVRQARLRIEEGERAVVVGPSGCGKTTLLRLIAGFVHPDAGRIALDGATLVDGASAVPPHRRPIGLVSQDGSLFPHLSVERNIAFGLDRRARGGRDQVRVLMAMVELDEALASRRPHELSGGQQQRVALARALARRPRLMLFDEPFSALDVGLRASLRRTVSELLRRENIAAVLVTHDREEALSFGDQVVVMRDGLPVQAGEPQHLYRRPADAETAVLLGDALILPAVLAQGRASCALGLLPVARWEPGAARIMLRPEQVGRGAAGDSPPFEVVAVEFHGASNEVLLETVSGTATPASFRIRLPAAEAAQVGDTIFLRVTGDALALA